MQYTPHYNLNLPEGTDIVNPLIQDNPNYSAIDNALYANKQRVVGTATHTKVGTNHSIVLADSDIPVFRFVATGDYATGDTFSVDGVTVTPRLADGSSVPNGAFKINSTVMAVLDGTLLNLINVSSIPSPSKIILSNGLSVEQAETHTRVSDSGNITPAVGSSSSVSFTMPNDGRIYVCNVVFGLGNPGDTVNAGIWIDGTADLSQAAVQYLNVSDFPVSASTTIPFFAVGNGGNIRVNVWTRATSSSTYTVKLDAVAM